MWIVPFELARREVWFKARVHGPLGVRGVKCLLDTGTGITIVNTPVLDSLGTFPSIRKGNGPRPHWSTQPPTSTGPSGGSHAKLVPHVTQLAGGFAR